MGRQKQSTPLHREISSEYTSKADRTPRRPESGVEMAAKDRVSSQVGIPQLIMAVGGIYASFLTWALLQERLTTKPYGEDPATTERFTFPVFLNTVQSLLAALTGYLYLIFSRPRSQPIPAIFPSSRIILPLLLVSLTTSLASPFGYASLRHIDYITFILAKSCKLLPVMFLHVTLFRRSFPLYKYIVVLAVTAGVAVFTLHASSSSGKKRQQQEGIQNRTWGLLLLGVNLLLDGLTNTTQDYIFTAFRPYTGPQMMCANNLMGTAITVSWLALSPYLAHTGLGAYLGMDLSSSTGGSEFWAALAFLAKHPAVWRDVLGFAACGAVGQVFIFFTLQHFSSLLLVTVTVTRKMTTMILSVVWFGHRLSGMQWLGVGLVFGGVGAEAVVQRREKQKKSERMNRENELKGTQTRDKKNRRMSLSEVVAEEIRSAAREPMEVGGEGKKEL